MKTTLPFFCIVIFICLLQDAFSQTDDKYPIEIAEINVNTRPGEPRMLLSATVISHDFYEITLRVEDQANLRVKKTVHPFTTKNFKESLRDAYTFLLKRYNNKYKNDDEEEEQRFSDNDESLEVDSTNFVHSKQSQNYISKSLSSPINEHEKELFYQLKGSEVASPIGSERPIAGDICFTQKLIIHRELDPYNEMQYEADRNDYVQKKWKELAVKINKDPINVPESTRKALEQSFDLDYTRINDKLSSEGNKELEKILENRSDLEIQKYELRNSVFATRERLRQISAQINRDTSLNLDTKRNFLSQMSVAMNRLEPMVLEEKSEEIIKFVDTCGLCKVYTDSLRVYLAAYENYRNILESIKMNNFDAKQHVKDLLPNNAKKTYNFEVEYVELEFNEGFVENIIVVGEVITYDFSKLYDSNVLEEALWDGSMKNVLGKEGLERKRIKFENRYPLGFSRKRDYESLNRVEMTTNGKNAEEKYTLQLLDLLTIYLPKLEVGRRDYSPENKVIRYDPRQSDGCITLYKEATSKLFEARVYSDFVGIDEKASNGLVQTEIAKRMNLNTGRIKRRKELGICAWFEPTVTISKIEQNNRDLILDNFATTDSVGRRRVYASTLDIRRHESFNAGSRTNIVYWDFVEVKTNVSLNIGLNYGRTPISIPNDTTVNGVNTFSVSPELLMDIKADERWGLSLAYRVNYMDILSRDVVQVADVGDPENKIDMGIRNKLFWSGSGQVFFQPSEDNRGRLFFRYRYSWQHNDFNLGFHQVQLGYSFYLLGRNKSGLR